MLNTSISLSDSLISSLCREVEYIRNRYRFIKSSLGTCKDNFLKIRLTTELKELKERRTEIFTLSKEFNNKNSLDISTLFLHELCKRPL